MLKQLFSRPLAVTLTLLFVLAGCTLVPKQDGNTEASNGAIPQDAVALAKQAGMADDLYYNLIAAELAGQYEELDNAAQAYHQALRISANSDLSQENKYQIARRAWEIGRFTKNVELAEQAAQIWQGQDDSFTPLLARIVAVENADAQKQRTVLAQVLDLPPARRTALTEVVAQHYSQSADSSFALPMIENWLEQYPNDADMLKAGALIAEKTDASSMAYQWWYRLSELAKDSQQLFDAQAHAAANLRLLGEPAEAAQRLAGLHALQPENHWVTLEYGRALMQSEQVAEAVGVLDRLATALPGNPEVLHFAGFAAFVNKEFMKAAQRFEEALNKGYDDHEARYWVGLAYMQAQQPKQGIVWLGTLGQGPRWQAAQRLIGDALAKLADWDDFTAHYQGLRAANADDVLLWYMAEAQSLISVDEYATALEVVDKAVVADPADSELRYQRGLLLIERERFQEAVIDLQYVVEQESDHADAMNALGYLLIDRMGEVARGLPLVKRALDLRPNSAPVMDSYGWGLLLSGDLEAGLFWLQKAWDNYKDHEIGAHLGEALWLNNRKTQARAIWREAQQISRGSRKDKVRQAHQRLGLELE